MYLLGQELILEVSSSWVSILSYVERERQIKEMP
jgi:hypothetical protein